MGGGLSSVLMLGQISASNHEHQKVGFFCGTKKVEPLPFAPILGILHLAPSETESGQLVKGPASLKIDKLEGLTERIRIGTTGRSYQMHKMWV